MKFPDMVEIRLRSDGTYGLQCGWKDDLGLIRTQTAVDLDEEATATVNGVIIDTIYDDGES